MRLICSIMASKPKKEAILYACCCVCVWRNRRGCDCIP
nr:MAG TPA: hypothetical protein [Caudoviricetes sp.]